MTTMVLSPTPYMGLQYLGAAAAGCEMFTYAAGTTTKLDAFTDSTGGTALPNPIILNANGDVAPSAVGTSCGLWIDPTLLYKIVFCPPTAGDPPTSNIWTLDNVAAPENAVLAQLAAYEAQLAGVPIGSIVPYGGSGSLPIGWYFCYGQALSRTTNAALFAVIGTAFGVGDASTTFNLPDLRGRTVIGGDTMGGTPANRVTFGVSGINGATVGAVGGDQNAQADVITVTNVVVQPTIVTSVNVVTSPISTPGSGIAGLGVGYQWPAGTVTATASGGTVTSTATSQLTGASQNMQPVQVANYAIYAGA